MTRLQASLLVLLALLVAVVMGRAGWAAASVAFSALPDALALATAATRAVPEWVWWTVFGAVWWLPCALSATRWSPWGHCASRPSA